MQKRTNAFTLFLMLHDNRFEQADINDPSLYTENSFDANGNSLPLLLVLGYTQGVQVRHNLKLEMTSTWCKIMSMYSFVYIDHIGQLNHHLTWIRCGWFLAQGRPNWSCRSFTDRLKSLSSPHTQYQLIVVLMPKIKISLSTYPISTDHYP